MEKFDKQMLNDLHLRTSLLEALDWNESELERLLKFLYEQFMFNYAPEVLLNIIEKEFNTQISSILKDVFVEIYIQNGNILFPKGEDIEH